MLTERREAIATKALVIEILELWGSSAAAGAPDTGSDRCPTTTGIFPVAVRRSSCRALRADSEPLAEVLEEIFLIAIGEKEIINWRPPAIEAMLSKLTEPL